MRFLFFLATTIPCFNLFGNPTSEKIYQDIYWNKCDSLDAVFYLMVNDTIIDYDSCKRVYTYSVKNVLLSIKEYTNFEEDILNGKCQHFYPTGKLFYIEFYKNGKRDGEMRSYFESGELRRLEVYENGTLIKGNCYTKSGEDTTFYPMEVLPEFIGGEKALKRFLRFNIKYPKQARYKEIEGQVFIRFIINSSGRVSDIQIANKVNPILEEEAVRVISKMDGKWKPGLQENKPVDVRYMMPINFKLQ